MFDEALIEQATTLLDVAKSQNKMIATAESCTGGLIAALLTEIAGSSSVFDRGFVTYSNDAKQSVLGVPQVTITAHGAVSEATARAMAEGALRHSKADLAVAVTGVAGPGGGSAEKPVGLVHMAVADHTGVRAHIAQQYGDVGRGAVRKLTVRDAVAMLQTLLDA
ncbi:MAG: CinA family protein [Pseudomonadota bacterium]